MLQFFNPSDLQEIPKIGLNIQRILEEKQEEEVDEMLEQGSFPRTAQAD